MKSIFTSLFFVLASLYGIAQSTPSYIPTSNLIGWWPFSGNANDLSGNGNNGTVYGASLTTDRFGEANKAYSFDGAFDYIDLGQLNNLSNVQELTISAWFYSPYTSNSINEFVGIDFGKKTTGNLNLRVHSNSNKKYQALYGEGTTSGKLESSISDDRYIYDEWNHVVGLYKDGEVSLYVNGVLQTKNIVSQGGQMSLIDFTSLYFGRSYTDLNLSHYFYGNLDDIGIWDRCLTEEEISNLYEGCNSVNSNYNIILAQNYLKGDDAVLTINPSISNNVSVSWESNPNDFGWMSVPSNSKYSGNGTGELTVYDLNLSNYHQSFRAIVNDDYCSDTTDVVYIEITDTCIVYDTVTIEREASITLIEDETIEFKVYPNPSNSKFNVEFPTKVIGNSFRIINVLGQEVYQSKIEEENQVIYTDQLNGKGVYYINVYDKSGKLNQTKKVIVN